MLLKSGQIHWLDVRSGISIMLAIKKHVRIMPISSEINWCYPSGFQQSAAGPSQLLVLMSGTLCRKRRHQRHHWRFSVNI